MRIRITTSGLKDVKKALREYGKTKTEEIRDEINATALQVEGEAKRLTPVDTGRLRSSIHAVPVNASDPETGVTTQDMEAAVTTNVDYAPYVEFGTENRSPHPYLFPAWEKEREKHIERLKKILNQVS